MLAVELVEAVEAGPLTPDPSPRWGEGDWENAGLSFFLQADRGIAGRRASLAGELVEAVKERRAPMRSR